MIKMFEDRCTMLHERNGVKFANKKYPREQVPRWIILDQRWGKPTPEFVPKKHWQPASNLTGNHWFIQRQSHLHSKLKINLIHYLSFTQASITKCGNLVFFFGTTFVVFPHMSLTTFWSPRVLACRSRKALSRWISIATAHRRWSKIVGFEGLMMTRWGGVLIVFPCISDKKPLDTWHTAWFLVLFIFIMLSSKMERFTIDHGFQCHYRLSLFVCLRKCVNQHKMGAY